MQAGRSAIVVILRLFYIYHATVRHTAGLPRCQTPPSTPTEPHQITSTNQYIIPSPISMALTPIVIGVGDKINRSLRPEDAREPLDLMTEAIQLAFMDAGLSSQLIKSIDSIDIVKTWTWPYPDLPGLISKVLACSPKHKFESDHGGNQPAKLFDDAAKRISSGDAKVAVIVGGEALASISACAAAKQLPPKGWTKLDQNVTSVFSPTTRDLGDDLGAVHGIGAPIHVYPLYENGFRAHRNQSLQDNNEESAELYAGFAKVAEKNEQAWQFGKPAATKEAIGNVSKKNRMICSPCKLFPHLLALLSHDVLNCWSLRRASEVSRP